MSDIMALNYLNDKWFEAIFKDHHTQQWAQNAAKAIARSFPGCEGWDRWTPSDIQQMAVLIQQELEDYKAQQDNTALEVALDNIREDYK